MKILEYFKSKSDVRVKRNLSALDFYKEIIGNLLESHFTREFGSKSDYKGRRTYTHLHLMWSLPIVS